MHRIIYSPGSHASQPIYDPYLHFRTLSKSVKLSFPSVPGTTFITVPNAVSSLLPLRLDVPWVSKHTVPNNNKK